MTGKKNTVRPYLWFSLRLAVVAWFFASGFRMAKEVPGFPSSGFWVFAVVVAVVFPAWRFYSILAAERGKRKEGHDWNASLWFSPILKNPQSFLVMGGASIGCAGLGLMMGSRAVFPAVLFISFGLGTLSGVLIFRWKNI